MEKFIKYDQAWPEKFQVESEKIYKTLGGDILEIQHIGSTSIAGIAAKSIIDIAVLVNSIEDINHFVLPLSKIGYEYKPEMSSVERIFFRKRNPVEYHLSIACPVHLFWDRNIKFRDYLRSHPDLAKEYEKLKTKNLAETPDEDFDDLSRSKTYNKGKGDFVERILNLAQTEVSKTVFDID